MADVEHDENARGDKSRSAAILDSPEVFAKSRDEVTPRVAQ